MASSGTEPAPLEERQRRIRAEARVQQLQQKLKSEEEDADKRCTELLQELRKEMLRGTGTEAKVEQLSQQLKTEAEARSEAEKERAAAEMQLRVVVRDYEEEKSAHLRTKEALLAMQKELEKERAKRLDDPYARQSAAGAETEAAGDDGSRGESWAAWASGSGGSLGKHGDSASEKVWM